MRPDFRTFQYSSRAKIPIHHGARTDRKGRIDRKQAYIPCQPLLSFYIEMNNVYDTIFSLIAPK